MYRFSQSQPLTPGTRVIRLTPSTTGRQIGPGAIGVIGGADPSAHNNSNWGSWSFQKFPVQWIYPAQSSGLWSSLDPMDESETFNFYSSMPSSFNMDIPQNDDDDAENYQGGIA
jgi:hypothetical protein